MGSSEAVGGKGNGSLTFVVPVRDPRGVSNWAQVKSLIEATMGSLAQAGGRVVVAASRGTELPPIPDGFRVVELDLPYKPLPATEGPERHAAVRRDKGARIIAGLVAEQRRGHVMVVDYDDFVSRKLSGLPAADPNASGWFVDSGYLFDGGRLALKHPTGFNRMCGTSLLLRADLLRIPRRLRDVDPEFVDRTLGSHVFVRKDLARAGTPLTPVPFPGAVYRIGHRDSTSPPRAIHDSYLSLNTAIRHPRRWLRSLSRIRLASSISEEFGLRQR